MKRLTYLLKETLANIRLNRTTTVIAVGTTAFTLACFGMFLLLYLNLKGVVSSLQEDIQVIIYLQDGLSGREITDLRQRLRKEPEVGTISYVSKDQALKEFREQFPSEQDLLDGLRANPLPGSLIVTILPQFRSPDGVKRWADRQKGLPGVDQVQYSRDWIESLEIVIGYLELASVAIGALLAAASITIIASTIRLTLYARRDEIEILSLIGATRAFIRVPYLLEGAILGATGGALSVAILKGGFEFFKSRLGASGHFLGVDATFGFLPVQVSVVLVAVGLFLGSTGSFLSLLQVGRTKS